MKQNYKFLFWLLQLTWGILDNILGALIFLVLVIFKQKPKRFHQMIYFEIGNYWGGFNCGFVAVVNENPSEHLLKHEHGHFIQNIIFGPFEIFIQIASAIRYWYRELKYYRKGLRPTTTYDSIWFEGQATQLGYKYLE